MFSPLNKLFFIRFVLESLSRKNYHTRNTKIPIIILKLEMDFLLYSEVVVRNFDFWRVKRFTLENWKKPKKLIYSDVVFVFNINIFFNYRQLFNEIIKTDYIFIFIQNMFDYIAAYNSFSMVRENKMVSLINILPMNIQINIFITLFLGYHQQIRCFQFCRRVNMTYSLSLM